MRPHKKSSFPTSGEWIELVTLVRVLGRKPGPPAGSLTDLTHPQVILIVHFSTLEKVISLLASGQSKLMDRERKQYALHLAFREDDFIIIRQKRCVIQDWIVTCPLQKSTFYM